MLPPLGCGRRTLLALILCLGLGSQAGSAARIELLSSGTAVAQIPLSIEVRLSELPDNSLETVRFVVDGREAEAHALGNGEHEIELAATRLRAGRHELEAIISDGSAQLEIRAIPLWLSILPPAIAIALALLTKEVLLSLFSGLFAGALFLNHWNPFSAFARTIDSFIVPAVADPDQAAIIVFTALLGGMVALVNRSGGTLGIVDRLQVFATSASRGQFATWLLGVVIFFDDYANTLIVGSTMRPITDRLRISREKLAYMVDSTAAPVASIFPISSWIGFEVGLIAAAFATVGIELNAYTTFVASIPYRFYPIFALVLGFTIAVTGRDFGPMLKAERRARHTGKVLGDDAVPLANFGVEEVAAADTPRRAINALLPIATVVFVTIGGMLVSGSEGVVRADFDSTSAWLREVFGNSNSYAALCWASLAGVVVGFVLPVVQGIFTTREGIEATVEGFKSVLLALVVLVLAWSIGGVCEELHTADFVVSLTTGILSPHWLPVLVFVLSAAVAFATGSSWGTLGILMPLVVPIAHGLSTSQGMAVDSSMYTAVLVGTISSVLAGSVWGDHCSPISDTTILSSTASGCDHIAHVRTQMPYALSMGFLGMLIGDIPTAFGLSPWISILLGVVVIVAGVLWFGRRSDI